MYFPLQLIIEMVGEVYLHSTERIRGKSYFRVSIWSVISDHCIYVGPGVHEFPNNRLHVLYMFKVSHGFHSTILFDDTLIPLHHSAVGANLMLRHTMLLSMRMVEQVNGAGR